MVGARPFMSKIFRSKRKEPEKGFNCRLSSQAHQHAKLLAEYWTEHDGVKWSLSDVVEQSVDYIHDIKKKAPDPRAWHAKRRGADSEVPFTCRVPLSTFVKVQEIAELWREPDGVDWGLSDVAEQAVETAFAEERKHPDVRRWLSTREGDAEKNEAKK